MSLSSALSIAQSSIRNTARQTSILSRNVLEAGNTDYSRRTAVLVGTAPGASIVDVQRAANDQLFRQNLSATSAYSGQKALYDGLDRLALSVNGVDNSSSAATALSRLQDALQLYSATPSNPTLAENALDAARNVVRSLNDGANAIQTARMQADQDIGAAVADLNGLLADFKDANSEIISGTRAGRDIADALDRRDALLKRIADYVPVSSIGRSDNDMVLVTADGATLFETVARTVSFTATGAFGANTVGSAVTIDGVPLKPGAANAASGAIAGLLQIRDGAATMLQSQLDEVARGLVSAFSETDPSATPALPDRAGLFTWSGGPALPASGAVTAGLAGTIRLNAAIDTAQGGNALRLRDGGANGAAYVANTGANASYANLLIAYGDRLDQTMAFDAGAGLGASSSLSNFASNSIGWLQGVRKEASTAYQNKEALAIRTAEALSNDTGVNVEAEMSLLLDLEHSYQASARILQAVDDMLAALLSAVR